MGMLAASADFSTELPSVEDLCAEVEAQTGWVVDFEPEPCESAARLRGRLQFRGFDRSAVEIRWELGSGESTGGVVHLQGFVGQETTLWVSILGALERLGGAPSPPLSDGRREQMQGPLSYWELRRRHLSTGLAMGGLSLPLWLLFLPLLLFGALIWAFFLGGAWTIDKILGVLMPTDEV